MICATCQSSQPSEDDYLTPGGFYRSDLPGMCDACIVERGGRALNDTREMPARLAAAHHRLAVLEARALRGTVLFRLAVGCGLLLAFVAGLVIVLHGPVGLAAAVPSLGLCWLASVISEHTDVAADQAAILTDLLGDN